MSAIPPSRLASTATEPRRVSAALRHKSRVADQENRPDSKASTTRKTSVATRETRTERRTIDERLIRRTTKSPLKPADGRKNRDAPERGERAEKVRKEEPPAQTWYPQATLLPPTSTAPLASRISIPPLSQHAPAAIHPPPLSGLGLQEQETALIEDLLYVLMGMEGQYVRYVESYNPLHEISRFVGPTFRIAHGLDPSLRDLASGMLKTATQYAALEVFVETMGRQDCGTVNHALCAAIRKSLKDYLILMAQLEHQALTNEGFTLHQMNLHLKPAGHMMTQLYSLAQEVLKENSLLGEDDTEDDADQPDELEQILESLREGRDAALPGSKKKTCEGGAVLRLLTRRLQASAGDPTAAQLLRSLLRESSRPYVRMLNEWLHHGNVRDPHAEFLIKEQKSIRREGLQQDYTDEYWEKRYTIRPELVPPQLEGVKDRVLLAGKYLNVVRECGGIADANRDLSGSAEVPQTFDDPRFLENVSSAYAFANRSLMTLLLTTHSLPSRLRSLKHYFFLDRSDFFSHFLELSASELRKPAKHVNAAKLQSLLEIVLRQPGSVAAEDPFKEDVRVTMSDTGLTGWLMRVVNVQGMDADASSLSLAYTGGQGSVGGKDEKDISGYEALTLDYAVPFPISLIISRNTLTRYQLLFRYLLSLRHLEVLLVQSWAEHTKAPAWIRKARRRGEGDEAARRLENWKRRAWCLRARMLCFVQQLLYFCTSEVIEPNWRGFMARLSHADEVEGGKGVSEGEEMPGGVVKVKRTVDELMQDHVDFLATCLKECMLTNSKLLRINSKVMSTCTLFANYTSSLSRYLASADPTSSSGDTAYDPAKLDKLFSILQQYEDHFSRHLKILLDALNYLAATETVVFLGLCARLSMANEGGPGGGAGPAAYG
ncbi:gamma tubulin complex Spc97/GCP2 subunit Alp4 [Teratosphaeriaceae sp. CCFEE 6253]|nr:gamma tubulin complex Spc97/GCP2 subunit Alp4 [Teratosphaeriaceae sp. CCFEE 6253]